MVRSLQTVGGAQPHRSSISSRMIGIIKREGAISVYWMQTGDFVLAGTVELLIIETLRVRKLVSTGALMALDAPLMVQTFV